MADPNLERTTSTTKGLATWTDEDRYWRENFRSRPYVTADRGYEFYQPAYRYGYESATQQQYRGRQWHDVENELRFGWDRYAHRSANKSTWQEIKDAVRDAWHRVTG